ncbi:MAG: DUF3298 domain-containing protein [Moheibacter sp.]
MKNISSFFVFVIFISFGFSQASKYYVMDGTVDKYPIRMELTVETNLEEGNSEIIYSGVYYYKSQQIPIEISQSSLKGSQLELTTFVKYDSEEEPEVFKGKFDRGNYKGEWQKGKRTLSFELKPADPSTYTAFGLNKSKRIVHAATLKDGSRIEGTYEFEYFLPNDKNFKKEMFHQIISTDYDDFVSYANSELDVFEKEYKEEIQGFIDEGLGDDPMTATWNYEYFSKLTPYFNSPDFLIMQLFGYNYSGGAHGMSYQQFFNYSKKNGKWIEINDVLDLNRKNEILKVLDKQLRKEFNIPAGVKYSDAEGTIFINNDLSLSENFSISKAGITFYYGLYDMTPYVYGFFELFVPYENLKPYLKKGFEF